MSTIPPTRTRLSHSTVWALLEDRDGFLWAGTGLGLNRLDPATGRWRRFLHDPDDPDSLSDNVIRCIYQDQRGTIWVGTYGGGLNRWDPKTGKFHHFTQRDGLPNDVLYGILEDAEGRLWISTNGGLSRFDPYRPSLPRFRNFDVGDGLQSNEFNTGAYARGPGGEMFFGGVNGFTAFFPDRVLDNPHLPPVVITAFHAGGRPRPVGRPRSHPPRPGRELPVLRIRRARLHQPAQEPVRLPAGRLRPRLGVLPGPPVRRLHQPGPRALRVPGEGFQQRRPVEHAGGRAASGNRPALLADLVVPGAGGPGGAGVVWTAHRLRLRAVRAAKRRLGARVNDRTAELKTLLAERDALVGELTQALEKVKTLKGLLPMCAHCKKIRDDQGYWQQVEVYIEHHSEAEFTHGLCPECTRQLYPDAYQKLHKPEGK